LAESTLGSCFTAAISTHLFHPDDQRNTEQRGNKKRTALEKRKWRSKPYSEEPGINVSQPPGQSKE